MQAERDRGSLRGTDDEEVGFSTKERELLKNRNTLDDAKRVAYEMEDTAKDIKYNLGQQTHKLQNSTMSGLYNIQRDLTVSNKLLNAIDWERKKNKWTIRIVLALLTLSIFSFVVMQLWPESSE